MSQKFLFMLKKRFVSGFNPCWKETVEFRLRVPELACIVLSVMDKDKRTDDDLVGFSVILVSSLKQGKSVFSNVLYDKFLIFQPFLFIFRVRTHLVKLSRW